MAVAEAMVYGFVASGLWVCWQWLWCQSGNKDLLVVIYVHCGFAVVVKCNGGDGGLGEDDNDR